MKTWRRFDMVSVVGLLGMLLAMAGLAGMLGGCESWSAVRHVPAGRSCGHADRPLPNVASREAIGVARPFGPSGLVALLPPAALDEVKGTYEFTVPGTVTQIKRSTNDFEQYSLYMGRPGPGDTPFLVITVGPHVSVENTQPDSTLRADATRMYGLNGLITHEWTGYTTDRKLPFCELLVSHDLEGDRLQAVAVAKNAEQRKLALEFWEALRGDR